MTAGAPAFPAEKPMTVRDWVAVFGAIIGAFMAILDIQITNASVREITGGLGATIDDGSWISTAYLVAEIVVIPLSGWLTRLFSLRNYLLGTSALFLFFSIACAMSWNLESMIVFRTLQGFTGGALIPLAFQVLLKLPPSKRTVGMALFAFTATFAPAIGPTVGGYLTDAFNWSAIFYLNVAPGIALIFACLYGIEKQPANFKLLKSMDRWGIFTMAIGLSSLTIFLEEGQKDDWFGSPLIRWLAASALFFIAAFLTIELRSKNPFINLRLLTRRNFGLGSLANVSVGMAMYGALYLLPLYLSSIQGYDSMHIGETMMWAGFPQLFILPFVPQLLKRVDPRAMAFVGLNLFALSCFMTSQMSAQVGFEQLRWSQLVRAIGQPLLMVPLTTITTGLIEPEQAGSASGLFNMLRNLGGSVGIAALSTVLTLREQFHSQRIGENVTAYSAATRERLQMIAAKFVAQGFDPVTAGMKALAATDAAIRREALTMGFNDCFFLVGCALAGSSCLILLCKPVTGGLADGAH